MAVGGRTSLYTNRYIPLPREKTHLPSMMCVQTEMVDAFVVTL